MVLFFRKSVGGQAGDVLAGWEWRRREETGRNKRSRRRTFDFDDDFRDDSRVSIAGLSRHFKANTTWYFLLRREKQWAETITRTTELVESTAKRLS